MPIITGSTPAPRVVLVSSANNVNTVVARPSTVGVTQQNTVATTTDSNRTVVVAAAGPQGAKGDPGLSAAGLLPPINFAFGDATPTVVLTLGETSEFTQVSLQIEQAFDGAGAAIKLGTAGNPALLMDSWQNDPSSVGVYELSPREELPSGSQIILTITPGAGASQGQGQFILSAVPTT